MKIGFDAKRYFHNNTGLGNYSREVVDVLIRQYPENKYYLFDQNPSTLELPANTIAVVPASNAIIWRTLGIQKDIKLHGLDIYHGLSNELPFGKWPENTKKIVTIHDVIFRAMPQQYSLIDRQIYHFKTKHAIKIADSIVATSEATAADLMEYYNADEQKIKVIYQTCGEQHWRTYNQDSLNSFAFNKRLPKKFLLYVSSFQTRKNHLQLLKALKKSENKEINLVLAGRKAETFSVCKEYIEANNLGSQVIILNELQNSELPLLYRSAAGFIYPSLNEGFGIPLLEAACAGLPMAVNDISVFRELAPESAITFTAENIDSFTNALKELWQMKKVDYLLYLEKFTSSKAAEKTFDVYANLVK